MSKRLIHQRGINFSTAGWLSTQCSIRCSTNTGKGGGHESGFHPCRCGREASELSGLPAGSRAADFTFLTRRPMLFRDRSWKILQGGSWGGKCDWIVGVHNFSYLALKLLPIAFYLHRVQESGRDGMVNKVVALKLKRFSPLWQHKNTPRWAWSAGVWAQSRQKQPTRV